MSSCAPVCHRGPLSPDDSRDPSENAAEKKGRDHRRVIGNDFSSLLTHEFRRAERERERERGRGAPVDRIAVGSPFERTEVPDATRPGRVAASLL